MSRARGMGLGREVAPFAALSASYFAHIGFFNPYLPLWLKHLGLPIVMISLLTAVQPLTRIFAPYIWGMVSDRTGERVRLLRYSAFVALAGSAGLWWNGGPVWLAAVLLLLFVHTSSMMSLTEAAMSHLVAGDWGRYGRIRLCGSVGFMATVFLAGGWFEHFGMGHFPGWATVTLMAVLASALWLPDLREAQADPRAVAAPIGPVLRQPAVRWFFAALFFHVLSHIGMYAFLSLYLDANGYSKVMIGVLWAVSVLVEVAWFFWQGRFVDRLSMPRWLVLTGMLTVVRMALTAGFPQSLAVLFLAQMMHALTFAAHHTACIALVTHHFPGRLRGRGQALFTVVGYGIAGVAGILVGGGIVERWGYQAVFAMSSATAVVATACAWRFLRLEQARKAGTSR